MSGRRLLRALLVWVVIIAAETAHGVVRGRLLVPLVGDLSARRIGVPVGSLVVLAVASLSVRWIAARTRLQLLGVGLPWAVLTALFEIGLGRFALGLPWERIAGDYDHGPWRLPRPRPAVHGRVAAAGVEGAAGGAPERTATGVTYPTSPVAPPRPPLRPLPSGPPGATRRCRAAG